MNENKGKLSVLKMVITIISIAIIIFLTKTGTITLKNIAQICVVEEGVLKFEENSEGYIIRDEIVLQGENYKNGMDTIISEGQRIAKDKPVFRYYSNGESEILSQIDTLDDEINAAIESSGLTIFSTDISNLEMQIEKIIDSMYQINDLEKMHDKLSELNTYIDKKTKITGTLSPADSHIKKLIEKRNELENRLNSESEIINSPKAGMVSYRIDGLEDVLRSF